MTDLEKHVNQPGRNKLVKQVRAKINELGIDYIIFQATEDFFTIGFNTLDKGQNWEGRLVSKDETKLNLDIIRELRKETFLICFDGKPVVNEKQMKRYDYAKIDLNKDYNVELNGGALGLFYKN